MNHIEFKEGFNLRYNNALPGAPGLDNYEISSYLTRAQLGLVKEAYSNMLGDRTSFELKEKSRRVLNELIKNEIISTSLSSTRGIVDSSVFFEIEEEPMYIISESAKISSSNNLYNNKVIEVVPIKHDEFFKAYKNPFKKPNKNIAWRLDLSKENSKTTVEIVSSESLNSYSVRYLKNPNPIIVSNLESDSEVGGMGLTIEGKTNTSTSELNSQVHHNIIDRAVELATLDYRQGDLQSRVQLNSRN